MEAILITPQTKKELQFLKTLLQNLNVKSRIIEEEEKEDLGLALLMKDVDRNEIVSRDSIMKKLQPR